MRADRLAVDVAGAFKSPDAFAAGDFVAWSAVVGHTDTVAFVLDESARQLLDRVDPGASKRYIERSADGRSHTVNPILGMLLPLWEREVSGNGASRLGWVKPYLLGLREHGYRVVAAPHKECVVGDGRGKEGVWRHSAGLAASVVESGFRYALHATADAMPYAMRLATGYCFVSTCLADHDCAGELCREQSEVSLRAMFQHYFPEGTRSGVREAMWQPLLESLLTNLVVRHTKSYHDVSGLSVREKVGLRLSDIGAYDLLNPSIFYSGLTTTDALDEWAAAMAMFHDVWQIEHDETKPDANMNICSTLLQSGVSVRGLSDYLTYAVCSTQVPEVLRRVILGWAVLTLTSSRHKTDVPSHPPERGTAGLWDNDNVHRVKRAIARDSELAAEDPHLRGCELDLREMRQVLDPDNNPDFADCTRSADKAVRMFRGWVKRYDVLPALLARSRFARSHPDAA